MKKIISLRVKRTAANLAFPFDIVYFFHQELETTIPKIFNSGIVMPITKIMEQTLSTVNNTSPFEMHVHTHNRNDAAKLEGDPLGDILKEPSKTLMLVPVLFTSWKGSSKQIKPLYLAKHTVSNASSRFPAKAYLLFKGQKFRPVCLACPFHMQAITGQCTASLLECCTRISFAPPSTFSKAIKNYEKHITSLGEQEIPNGGIHEITT